MPIAEFSLDGPNGGKILVDVDDADGAKDGPQGFRGVAGLVQAGQSFEASLAGMKTVASKVWSVIRELGPDEGEVTLGFKLTASSGVILAKMGGEANIGVKLVWKKAAPAHPTGTPG